MNWKSFGLGFLLAIVMSTVGFGWLINEISKIPITLPPKMFFETKNKAPGQGYIHFEGSIGGVEPTANPENIFSGSCSEASNICETQDVKMIGPNHLGSMNADTYQITKWSPDLVVAESATQSPECVIITLNIRRKDQVVEYVRSPKAPMPDTEFCDMVEKRTIVWTVGDPPSSR